jgi:hypothetical protein
MCKMHIGITMVGAMVEWTSQHARRPRTPRTGVNVLKPRTVEKPREEKHASVWFRHVDCTNEWNHQLHCGIQQSRLKCVRGLWFLDNVMHRVRTIDSLAKKTSMRSAMRHPLEPIHTKDEDYRAWHIQRSIRPRLDWEMCTKEAQKNDEPRESAERKLTWMRVPGCSAEHAHEGDVPHSLRTLVVSSRSKSVFFKSPSTTCTRR